MRKVRAHQLFFDNNDTIYIKGGKGCEYCLYHVKCRVNKSTLIQGEGFLLIVD